jgi:hypothetical protein
LDDLEILDTKGKRIDYKINNIEECGADKVTVYLK